jgi:hypothetical protein
MTGFLRLPNYIEDLKDLIGKARAKIRKKKPSTNLLEEDQPRRSLMPLFKAMANKTLLKFYAPTTTDIRTRLVVDVGEEGFKLKLALINMVHAN